MKLPSFSFTVLDTETTGLIPRVHTVIEFASVRVDGGKITDEYTQLFSIQEDLPAVTQTLTRIRPGDLKGKPTFADMREEVYRHIGTETVIMGQNVGFDIAMLKGDGLDLSTRPWIDTSMLASLVFPELASFSLGYVSTILQLHHTPVHRALGDVHATLELIERCWERFNEMPEEYLEIARGIGTRSTEAYRLFFSSMPKSTRKKVPTWLKAPSSNLKTPKKSQASNFKLRKPNVGAIDLIEEPLEPGFLQSVINTCSADAQTVHWIAVKNLENTVRNLTIPDYTRVLWPPFLLPDTEAVKTFARQQSLTADEATLAMKLAWYEPHTRGDIPIHGNERFVWNSKISCTDVSSSYTEQFNNLPHTILIDHRQLLSFLTDPEHAAHRALDARAHIIIDDASNLEETATKAYGWSLNMDDLRAGATGDNTLTTFVDVFQLWLEKTRGTKDTYVFTLNDFCSASVRGLKEQLTEMRLRTCSSQMTSMLINVQTLFEKNALSNNIVWMDTRQDGGQVIHAVPECIDAVLRHSLYAHFPTTLLIPPASANHLREILPPQVTTRMYPTHVRSSFCSLSFAVPRTLDNIFTNPLPGKTVVLMAGKHAIERAFVTYAESLERQGCALFCQGFSGGQGRFQAEFGAINDSAILLITPWIVEGLELPLNSLDCLVITSLPFDSPVYPTIARRSLHYQDPFSDYSLPRLEQRLFRILRTFCRFAKEGSEIIVTDERLETKKYGKTVKTYLRSLVDLPLEKNGQMELPLP